MTTTIRIKRKTKRQLEAIGRKNDSFDEIINDILHSRNIYEIQEYANNNSEDLLQETIRVFDAINYLLPEDINLEYAVETIKKENPSTVVEAITEVYCMINNILSPF